MGLRFQAQHTARPASSPSDGHFHVNLLVRLVVGDQKVLRSKLVDVLVFSVDFKLLSRATTSTRESTGAVRGRPGY